MEVSMWCKAVFQSGELCASRIGPDSCEVTSGEVSPCSTSLPLGRVGEKYLGLQITWPFTHKSFQNFNWPRQNDGGSKIEFSQYVRSSSLKAFPANHYLQ